MPETPKAGTVEIQLPPGMSQEDFNKAFESFRKQRETTKVRDKAVRDAQKELIKLHKDEYEKLVAKFMPASAE